jgi:hypothetical protein
MREEKKKAASERVCGGCTEWTDDETMYKYESIVDGDEPDLSGCALTTTTTTTIRGCEGGREGRGMVARLERRCAHSCAPADWGKRERGEGP